MTSTSLFRSVLAVILLIVGWYGDLAGAGPVLPEPPTSIEAAASSHDRRVEGVPETAYEVLAVIQQNRGKPPPGYVGGRTFMNRERRLPSGRYREYDVHPFVPGRNRGAERIVVDQRSGKAYYTGDHYRTFIPMH
ncbi:MAG: ribonuclease domain-containing protein [Nitrospiraceae bacterium]